MDGFHVEAPHISPVDGPPCAPPRPWMRPPELDEFGRRHQVAATIRKPFQQTGCVTALPTAAGAPPGRYYLGDQAVALTADAPGVLAGTDRLAGSALRMDRGIDNLMRLAGLSLADAIRMATIN